MILLHGRGSSAADIAGLVGSLEADDCAFLVPTAPGHAWYPQRFFEPLDRNQPALGEALEAVAQLVTEIGNAGLPPEKIALIGFSQGGCLALEFAARQPTRYRLVAGLSAALIGPLATPRAPADLQATPVLLGCAEADAHIPLPFVEHSAATLQASRANVTKQIYPGSAHTVFPEEIVWLDRHLRAP